MMERLPVHRPIQVLAPERRVTELRRKRVVGEFAIARQYFGASVEPGALGDVNPGARPLLIGHIGAVRSVIGTAAVIVGPFGLRARRSHVKTDSDNGGRGEQYRKLVRSRKFP